MLQAGGGIVADSDPTAEHHECLNKLAALEAAIDLARRARDDRPGGTDAARRQLRQLHVQPRAPVRGARRRRDGDPQRQARRRRARRRSSRRTSSSPPVPGVPPTPAPRSRSCGGSDRGYRRSASASATRRSSRPSAARSARRGGSSTARRAGSSTTARDLSRASPSPLEAGRYHSLAADTRARRARGLRDDRRRRGDGRPASGVPRRRYPVPSGVGADAARPRDRQAVPGGER